MSYLKTFWKNKQQRRNVGALLVIFFSLALAMWIFLGDAEGALITAGSAVGFVVLVWFPLSYLMRNNP